MIWVNVLMFGALKERCGGKDSVLLNLSGERTLNEALRVLGVSLNGGRHARRKIAVAVNGTLVRGDCRLHDRDEIALLPPVSGG